MATGKLLAFVGMVLLSIGLTMNYAPWLVNWFGRLPGDIRVEEDNKMLFIPITSMLIVSVILSIIVNVFFHE